jgi:thiamine pyrophosphokinase
VDGHFRFQISDKRGQYGFAVCGARLSNNGMPLFMSPFCCLYYLVLQPFRSIHCGEALRNIKNTRRSVTGLTIKMQEVIEDKVALIICNMPIESNVFASSSSVFQRLWNTSNFRVCADGGANRLYDASVGSALGNIATDCIPDLICGDFDSIQPHVLEYYQRFKRTEIQKDPKDQDTNDLEKSIRAILAAKKDEWKKIVVYGALDGRLDQTMASIQCLFKFSQHPIILYNERTTARLLQGNGALNTISIHTKEEGPSCGLLPVGSKCDWVYTTGLQWNLNGESMEFGGLVSTSNLILPSPTGCGPIAEVTVRSSHPLLWTTEITSLTATATNALHV